MMDEIPQQPVTVAEVARVGIDLPCITCGYNLRSLPMSGRCPECNSAIESALHHGWLRFADPQWLRRLRSGVTFTLWAVLVEVAAYVVSTLLLVKAFAPSSRTGPTDFLTLQVMTLTMTLGVAIAWLISVFMLTTPEPTHEAGGWPRRRGLAKWTLGLNVLAISLLISSAFCFGLMLTIVPGLLKPDALSVSFVIGGYASALTSMLGFFLLMVLMRRIAQRAPHRGLGKLMSVLIWGSVGLSVGQVAVVFFDLGGGAYTSFLGGGRLFSLVSLVISWGPVVGWIACVVVALFWFRSVFSRAIAQNVAHPLKAVAQQL